MDMIPTFCMKEIGFHSHPQILAGCYPQVALLCFCNNALCFLTLDQYHYTTDKNGGFGHSHNIPFSVSMR